MSNYVQVFGEGCYPNSWIPNFSLRGYSARSDPKSCNGKAGEPKSWMLIEVKIFGSQQTLGAQAKAEWRGGCQHQANESRNARVA